MSKAAKAIFRLCLVILATVVILEAVLQLAFTLLPMNLTQRMPQYRQRNGYRLRAEHGAREYPAGESVDLLITPQSGDLYRISCLEPANGESFDPYRVSYVRDGHGFRNPEPWADDVDLVILGDSFVAAESVQAPFWHDASETMLALGLPGSGTMEQALLLNVFGLPRNPELVALAFFAGNDMTDNLVFSELRAQGLTFADQVYRNRSPLEFLVTVHIALYIRDRVIASTQACHYPQVAQTTPPMPVSFFDEMLPMLAIDRDSLRKSKMFEATKIALIEMANALRENGARFLLMYIPQKAEVFWEYLDSEAKQQIVNALRKQNAAVTVGSIDNNLSAQADLIRDMATANGIDYIDLTPALRSAIESGSSPYFFADTHWNQHGHNIARQALRDRLN